MFKTLYITNCDTADESASTILAGYSGSVGFDTETYTQKLHSDPVDVVQIYVPWSDGLICYVFHIALFERLPVKLIKIFTSKSIIKICSAPENDAKWIKQKFKVQLLGTIDIQVLAQLKDEPSIGLDKLALKYIPNWEPKRKEDRLGKWHRRLTDNLLKYATYDAYASYYVGICLSPDLESRNEILDVKHVEVDLFDIVKSLFEGDKDVKTSDILSNLIKANVNFGTHKKSVIQKTCRHLLMLWYEQRKISQIEGEKWSMVTI